MTKTATVIDFPATTRARNKIRRSAHRRRMFDAFQAGFIAVNDQERELVQDLLRWTSFAGRDAVQAFAREMRKLHPWRYVGQEPASKP